MFIALPRAVPLPRGSWINEHAVKLPSAPALDALAEVDPDQLTPRAALELVYRLRALAAD